MYHKRFAHDIAITSDLSQNNAVAIKCANHHQHNTLYNCTKNSTLHNYTMNKKQYTSQLYHEQKTVHFTIIS